MLHIASLLLTHVPTYTGCIDNCCTPPHIHTTSQVIYLKGSGGLEIHVKNDTMPFNTLENEILDIDAVFRDEVDQTTYDLYIGCGGCIPSDPIVIPPLELAGYEEAEIEPFTQTRYRSVFPKSQRKYNSSLLKHSKCTEKHFTIRLVDYMNRTDGKPIIWAPVIGLAESFTFLELLEFPIYILKNHGETWNELGWTFYLWFFLGTPSIIICIRLLLRSCNIKTLSAFEQKDVWHDNLREICYEIAIIGFAAAGLEELTHLIYVQHNVEIKWGFYVGLFAVIFIGQCLPILFTYTVWHSMYHRKDKWCISNPLWGPMEIATGFSFLFLFGAGFYVGPAAIILAGSCRMLELRTLCKTTKHEKIEIEIQAPKLNTKQPHKFLGFLHNENMTIK
tara:strand:+ start:1981 stop:3153 length:1173 start_codon:yes stop_codon:yes gene_type:complete